MSFMFDESRASRRPKASFAHGGGQDSDSNFLREVPQGVAFARQADQQSLIQRAAPPNYFQRPKEGWKLFSPSTWKGLRNTAWGRRKADQRHAKRVRNQVNEYFAKLDGVGGKGDGTPYTGDASIVRPDPALSDSKAYGMHQDDAQAWGNMFKSSAWENRRTVNYHRDENTVRQAAENKQVGGGRMGMTSFADMSHMFTRREPGVSQIEEDDSRGPGDYVEGYETLAQPGTDDQDEGDGIPDIVRDVFAGTTRPADYQPEHPMQDYGYQEDDSENLIEEDPMRALHRALAGEEHP